ncbi:MAG: hypothetical protein MK101_08805 [Phycisphaerales bacterium]|nr:hypothetical protein [Phycisphaerales bacterium]
MSFVSALVLAVAASPGCDFQVGSVEWTACIMPPMECPNGLFTSVEECARAASTPGCGAQRTTLGWAMGVETNRQEVVHPCGSRYSATFARCQCTGNLFGFCMGPCRPVGGIVRLMPCPGSFSTVKVCKTVFEGS